MTPQIIVCACGKSSRFGSDKLAHPLDKKRSILGTVLKNILTGTKANSCVIVPAEKSYLVDLVRQENCEPLVMQHSSGLGDTIAFGVRHFPKAVGWLLCLGDMPFIPPDIYSKIYSSSSSEKITAPCYQGRRGHPVFFPKKFFNELTSLSGDKGGASILLRNQDEQRLIETQDASVLHDIDTRDDLFKLR